MRARRLIALLAVCLPASLVVAQPKKPDPKKAPAKGPVAPAKDTPAGPAPAPAAGSGSGDVVQMTEDPPPKDIEGRDENPDAPRGVGTEPPPSVTVQAAAPVKRGPYPIEEVARPITMPRNMSEVTIDPHFQVSPYMGTNALRARYGITPKVQLGLTYVLGAVYDDPGTLQQKQGFHPGKAVGLDLTVMIQDWIGVKVGVPVYIDSPVAVSATAAAPMKFRFGDRMALVILDDLLTVKINRFAPSFYQDQINATRANDEMISTIQSKGALRFSAAGFYQYQPKLVILGRVGVNMEDFATTKTDAGGGLTTFLRGGIQYTAKKYLDLGATLGFDDLAHGGSFGPAFLLAFRI